MTQKWSLPSRDTQSNGEIGRQATTVQWDIHLHKAAFSWGCSQERVYLAPSGGMWTSSWRVRRSSLGRYRVNDNIRWRSRHAQRYWVSEMVSHVEMIWCQYQKREKMQKRRVEVRLEPCPWAWTAFYTQRWGSASMRGWVCGYTWHNQVWFFSEGWRI